MIIAMVAMRMVQAAIDDVVDVIAVWHGFVTASGSMHMTVFVLGMTTAAIRILLGNRDHMLVDRAVGILAVQMAVMKVIDVITMPNRGMPSSGSVLMLVILLGNTVLTHNPSAIAASRVLINLGVLLHL